MTTRNSRKADRPIDPIFLDRWSPRGFTESEISQVELETLFEAARWAPSAYNSQPWRFIYARRNGKGWDTLLGLLNPFNQSWAQRAAALVFVVSKTTMQPPGGAAPVPSHSHSFDAGAAWANLALQASRSGWAAHGMTGVDFTRATTELNVPEGYRVEVAVAIGRPGDADKLPEALAARDVPSPRNPIAELAFEATFPAA